MKRLPPLLLALLLVACGPGGGPAAGAGAERAALAEAEPFDLVNHEGFGPLRLGLKDREVSALLGPPEAKGPSTLWGADDLYHAEWRYPSRGISLDLAAESAGGKFEVARITVSAPSRLRSWRGIAVGDSAEEVLKAYGTFIDGEAPADGERIVAGSVYGGLIFTLAGGRVSEMFLGAAAE